jgi:hypothetical protein
MKRGTVPTAMLGLPVLGAAGLLLRERRRLGETICG